MTRTPCSAKFAATASIKSDARRFLLPAGGRRGSPGGLFLCVLSLNREEEAQLSLEWRRRRGDLRRSQLRLDGASRWMIEKNVERRGFVGVRFFVLALVAA
jgi:hypothetical protein